MKIIPFLKVRDIAEAVAFYTEILDFGLKYPDKELNRYCVDLRNGDIEIWLSEIDGTPNAAVCVLVDDIDERFANYIKRGLITPKKEDSPVHENPVDQTWGMREFYVTDSSGNTLRFSQPITD